MTGTKAIGIKATGMRAIGLKARRTPLTDAARKGATALEFAFVAPVLFLFMMGIVELSLLVVTHHLMENAVFNASRVAKTGYTDANKTQLETVEAELITELNGLAPLLDVSKVTMSTVSYGSLTASNTSSGGSSGLGSAQEVLVFSITYPWTFFTPMISTLIGDKNGQMTLTSSIVVRNEPYS